MSRRWRYPRSRRGQFFYTPPSAPVEPPPRASDSLARRRRFIPVRKRGMVFSPVPPQVVQSNPDFIRPRTYRFRTRLPYRRYGHWWMPWPPPLNFDRDITVSLSAPFTGWSAAAPTANLPTISGPSTGWIADSPSTGWKTEAPTT